MVTRLDGQTNERTDGQTDVEVVVVIWISDQIHVTVKSFQNNCKEIKMFFLMEDF